MDVNDLVNFISEKAVRQWDLTKEPYLVAKLPGDLRRERAIDYKAIIGQDVRLKGFVNEHQGDSFTVVQHPSQKAKFGVIPSDQNYVYELSASKSTPASHSQSETSGRKSLTSFLEALNNFDDETLKDVSIPTQIIVRLFAEK